ncbi:methyltransferase [Sulfolobales archaeon HS-7]|nr:methyltransferase [Sulfolobales archaeon HS-7]
MTHYYDENSKLTGKKYVVTEVIDGIPLTLVSSDNVFSKNRIDKGTKILLENLVIPQEGKVLDLGCGIGVIGIYIALKNPAIKVVMSDVNPVAIKLAKYNCTLNKVGDRTLVVKTNLLDSFNENEFDAIISNPPLAKGSEFIIKMVNDAKNRLKTNALLEIVVKKGENVVEDTLKKYNYSVNKKIRKQGYTVFIALKN